MRSLIRDVFRAPSQRDERLRKGPEFYSIQELSGLQPDQKLIKQCLCRSLTMVSGSCFNQDRPLLLHSPHLLKLKVQYFSLPLVKQTQKEKQNISLATSPDGEKKTALNSLSGVTNLRVDVEFTAIGAAWGQTSRTLKWSAPFRGFQALRYLCIQHYKNKRVEAVRAAML